MRGGLSHVEVKRLVRTLSEFLWRHHDPHNGEHYASDVPHLIVVTPRIDSGYLTRV